MTTGLGISLAPGQASEGTQLRAMIFLLSGSISSTWIRGTGFLKRDSSILINHVLKCFDRLLKLHLKIPRMFPGHIFDLVS